jgi:subtilase family serine protease
MEVGQLHYIKSITISLMLITLSSTAIARSTNIVEPEPTIVNCSLTLDRMKAAIVKGGAVRGWKVVNNEVGNMLLKYVKGANKHTITVNVSYTEVMFDVTYADSTNLNYNVRKNGTLRIHPKPIGWMKNLDFDIQEKANQLCYE